MPSAVPEGGPPETADYLAGQISADTAAGAQTWQRMAGAFAANEESTFTTSSPEDYQFGSSPIESISRICLHNIFTEIECRRPDTADLRDEVEDAVGFVEQSNFSPLKPDTGDQ